jgi:hypothetical protein
MCSAPLSWIPRPRGLLPSRWPALATIRTGDRGTGTCPTARPASPVRSQVPGTRAGLPSACLETRGIPYWRAGKKKPLSQREGLGAARSQFGPRQNSLISQARVVRIRLLAGGIGTFPRRAPLAPRGLPGFTGPSPSTSLDKGAMRLSGATRGMYQKCAPRVQCRSSRDGAASPRATSSGRPRNARCRRRGVANSPARA